MVAARGAGAQRKENMGDTGKCWKGISQETSTKTEKRGMDHKLTQGQVGRGHVDNMGVHGNPSHYRASLITSCLCLICSQSCACGVKGHRVQRTLTRPDCITGLQSWWACVQHHTAGGRTWATGWPAKRWAVVADQDQTNLQLALKVSFSFWLNHWFTF